MINTITFDSQMAMAGALTSILSGKSSVNESAKQTKTDKKLVVESDKNGAATASDTSTVAANKPESAPEKTVKVEKVCESDTAQSRLEKFRAEHKAKKFGKKLKTCCDEKKVCEGEEDKKKKQTGAPVEITQPEEPTVDAGAAAAPAAAAGGVGEAEGDEATATVGSEEDAGAPVGGDDGEGDENTAPAEDNKELVAHASAVSERMASLKEKLVQELDADDGLKLGDKEGEEAATDGAEETGDVAMVDGADVDK